MGEPLHCPYGVPGDRLWVREAHRLLSCTCTEMCRVPQHVWYEADSSGYEGADMERLRPSIHMPRWASRLTLEITDVRVQRLNEISEEDSVAEGCMKGDEIIGVKDPASARIRFHYLWESINASRAPWESNPFVWAVSFKRVTELELRMK